MIMNQFKKCKVVMLETTGLNTIISVRRATNEMINIHPNAPANRHNDDQHLYITSDEEIKEGWRGIAYKDDVKGKIFKHFYTENTWYNDAEIVIASTDTSLGLPQPSQQFIEKYIEEYNKGNVITDILVEYDEFISNNKCNLNDGYHTGIKVNPKDNTITIKKIKDSWNREEVIEFGLKCVNLGMDLNNNPLPRLNEISGKEFYNNWIEQNL